MYFIIGIRWILLSTITICSTGTSWSQSDHRLNKIADSLINIVQSNQSISYRTKAEMAGTAFNLYQKSNAICQQVNARIILATQLDNLGLPDSALIQLYNAHDEYSPPCDSLILMSLYRNLTNVYLTLGENTKVDSVSQIALELWNSRWREKECRYAIMNNLAIAHIMRDDTLNALKSFFATYKEAVRNGNKKYMQIGLNNLGSLKGMTGDLDSAYYYFNQAALMAKQEEDMDNFISLLINLANLNGERGRYDLAATLLDSAYALSTTLGNIEKLSRVERARADIFSLEGDYKKAYSHLLRFIDFRESYLDEERIKAVTEMMEKYESEKKARQIQQLEIDKLDAILTNIRITNARNRFLIIGFAILLLAISLYRRLRYVYNARIAIQREKDISEGLLLNILPASVANELKTKGFAEAKYFEPVTILFSDFKSFTKISEELTPAELVEELNACYKAFDEIMTKYGIEKIKTIGDAYMAAGMIPDTNKATPVDVINAGLDMQYFVAMRKKERDDANLPGFEMRVGIHSGPVVAGIVGVQKFQYDLWGDTVNIASRMETNGQVGKVNISEATYRLVKDNPSFYFTSRGMINVKGKGELPMYFVERAVVEEKILLVQ